VNAADVGAGGVPELHAVSTPMTATNAIAGRIDRIVIVYSSVALAAQPIICHIDERGHHK
jgi:hypothetical protein